jgi:hypothetical protein
MALALAALGAAGAAGAQDARQEDRMLEQQAQREARVALPRRADGTPDTDALLDQVRGRLAAGAVEIQFRGDGLSAQEAQQLLLDGRVLADLAAALPDDGVERHVRLRGAVEARVQRNEEGRLRARVEDIRLGSLTPEQRADLARRLAAEGGFDRVRIRGTDAGGERVRIEFRDDRGIVRNESRGERMARIEHDRRGRDRVERAERPERAERMERRERVERAERPDRSGHH